MASSRYIRTKAKDFCWSIRKLVTSCSASISNMHRSTILQILNHGPFRQDLTKCCSWHENLTDLIGCNTERNASEESPDPCFFIPTAVSAVKQQQKKTARVASRGGYHPIYVPPVVAVSAFRTQRQTLDAKLLISPAWPTPSKLGRLLSCDCGCWMLDGISCIASLASDTEYTWIG